MFDPLLFLVIIAFNVVAVLSLNLLLARFSLAKLSRYQVQWRCNKYANHTTYILTVCDAVIRWTYIHPGRPSDNGKSPGRARC